MASGQYANATSHFFATEYVFKADGSFTSRYMANNPLYKFKSSGTWAIEEGLVVLHEAKGPKRFQILSLGTQPDGRVKLSLMKPGAAINEYTPTDDWYRTPARKSKKGHVVTVDGSCRRKFQRTGLSRVEGLLLKA
jgi:hypothetical protein